MTIDYQSHPSELATSGTLGPDVGIKQLREAIPPHCFEPSYLRSLYYLARDIILATGGLYAGYTYIPLIEPIWLRCIMWVIYGYTEGLTFVGLWILGHECGHSAFSKSDTLNNSLGFILHSLLLTPYFSWRSTHRRHHIYANNLLKDHNYVPPQQKEYASSLLVNAAGNKVALLEELGEDTPLVTFLRILLQQLIGFPWYLLTNITAAPTSLPKQPSSIPLGNSHFAPTGALFHPDEAFHILISDLGLLAMGVSLWGMGSVLGFNNLALLYIQPYLWLNHWIVAITYLHHTHPDLPKFENESWTFMKGATATIDRELGWVGKHMFHSIIEFHVIHHLFSRIPFYHAEEATQAIIPLLGDAYHSDKQRAYLPSLWESFTRCQWVEPENPIADPGDRTMWYKGGPSPPPETSMGKKGWNPALF